MAIAKSYAYKAYLQGRINEVLLKSEAVKHINKEIEKYEERIVNRMTIELRTAIRNYQDGLETAKKFIEGKNVSL